MPQVSFTLQSLQDLERFYEYLRTTNPVAAKRAVAAILKTLDMLEQFPQIGRPADEMDLAIRELAIEFGDSGYMAKYRYDGELVTVLTIRHQKEDGYI